MNELPAQLPQLRAGSHLTGDDGACFMEYASVLAGEPWSDRPRCTHPVVAALARLVNDATSPSGRVRLAELIPDVIGLNPDVSVIAPAVVEAATGAVMDFGGRNRSLRRHHNRAERRLHRLRQQPSTARLRWLERLYERGAAMRALESLVLAVRRLPPGVRDDVLRAALIAGIVVARDIQHLQGIDVRPCRVGKDQSSTTTSDGIYRDWFTTSGSKSVSKP
jgi:hypothetical protein